MKDDGRTISVYCLEEGDCFITFFFTNHKDMSDAGQRLYDICEEYGLKDQVKRLGHNDPDNPLFFHTDGDPFKRYGTSRHIHFRLKHLPTSKDWEMVKQMSKKVNVYIDPKLEPRFVKKRYTTLAEIFGKE